MNDCFWCFISGVCDSNKEGRCYNCKDYLSVSSEEGQKMFEHYSEDVEIALLPVAEKWKKIKENKNV